MMSLAESRVSTPTKAVSVGSIPVGPGAAQRDEGEAGPDGQVPGGRLVPEVPGAERRVVAWSSRPSPATWAAPSRNWTAPIAASRPAAGRSPPGVAGAGAAVGRRRPRSIGFAGGTGRRARQAGHRGGRVEPGRAARTAGQVPFGQLALARRVLAVEPRRQHFPDPLTLHNPIVAAKAPFWFPPTAG